MTKKTQPTKHPVSHARVLAAMQAQRSSNLSSVLRKVNEGMFAGSLAIEALSNAGVRPAQIAKISKALNEMFVLSSLLNSLFGENPKAFKAALFSEVAQERLTSKTV